MSFGVDIQMTIDKAAIRRAEHAFKVLAPRVFNRVVNRAASKAMTPVLRAAKRLVPVDDKFLKKSLGRKVKSYKRSGNVVVLIGPRKGFKDEKSGRNPANYAHLVEKGTAPHVIRPESRRALKIRGPDGDKFVGAVIHPGTPPRPFLRPALDGNKSAVVQIYKHELGIGLEREVAKLK
jgi:HK97 gp10 family phage protein